MICRLSTDNIEESIKAYFTASIKMQTDHTEPQVYARELKAVPGIFMDV